MTKSKLGAVAVMNEDQSFRRLFTDGDLRRLLKEQNSNIQGLTFSSMDEQAPITIDVDYTLFDARKIFNEKNVDTLVVTENGKFTGLIDIHHTI